MIDAPTFRIDAPSTAEFRTNKGRFYTSGGVSAGQVLFTVSIDRFFIFRRLWFVGGANGAGTIEPSMDIVFTRDGVESGRLNHVPGIPGDSGADQYQFFPSNAETNSATFGGNMMVINVASGPSSGTQKVFSCPRDITCEADKAYVVVTAAGAKVSVFSFLYIQSQNTPFGGGIPT